MMKRCTDWCERWSMMRILLSNCFDHHRTNRLNRIWLINQSKSTRTKVLFKVIWITCRRCLAIAWLCKLCRVGKKYFYKSLSWSSEQKRLNQQWFYRQMDSKFCRYTESVVMTGVKLASSDKENNRLVTYW